MVVKWEVLRRALTNSTKQVFNEKDLAKWAKKNKVDPDDLERISAEIATVAISDMRDNERGLLEALGGTFLSGFMAAFELLRPGVADETFKFIAEGKKVQVKVSKVDIQD